MLSKNKLSRVAAPDRVPNRHSRTRENEVEIPDRIRNIPGLRLIKIKKDDKKRPAEKYYLTKKNYSLPSP